MEKRFCCSAVCTASSPCRVGGLGGGAERCSEHLFLDAHDVGLLSLHGAAKFPSIPMRPLLVYPGIDVEADGGDASVCPVVVGLLATGPLSIWTTAGWPRFLLPKTN